MAARIAEEEEKRMFAEMNEQQRLKLEQRHLDDVRQMKEKREATTRILDQQVRATFLGGRRNSTVSTDRRWEARAWSILGRMKTLQVEKRAGPFLGRNEGQVQRVARETRPVHPSPSRTRRSRGASAPAPPLACAG